MEFNELKAKMEEMGFKFQWCDEDIEGVEENEDTGKERETTIHAKGWYMNYPAEQGFYFPRIFIPFDDPHKIGCLNVVLETYEKRHEGDEEEAKRMKHFEESFNARFNKTKGG